MSVGVELADVRLREYLIYSNIRSPTSDRTFERTNQSVAVPVFTFGAAVQLQLVVLNRIWYLFRQAKSMTFHHSPECTLT